MRSKFSLIVFIAVFLLSVNFSASAKVYLVSVGISDYPGTVNDLRLPVANAQHIAQIYSKNSSNIEYRLLLNSQATIANILNTMRTLYAKAGVDDIVVFFYSGHGYQGGFYVYDGNLDYAKIRSAIAVSKSRSKMIFADTCFSGKITTPKKASETDAKKANVMLFLSSRSNESSWERMGMANGFFTTYLASGLEGKADRNKDRVITAKELYDYVHSGVINLSNGEQHPVMWGNFPTNMKVMEW